MSATFDEAARREAYTRYIQSDDWRSVRAAALKRAGYCCESCGIPQIKAALQVHHKTYERFRYERPADLQVLCVPCHERADEERRAAVWQKRVSAWASKVYGRLWWVTRRRGAVELEFREWLRSQPNGR